ncbi:MAG: QacE family quaternary ammonium compound efflux SMR transporter [Desulfovibrionaceae bacterium]|jgi:small multidrug resistance pump|nr:QacE family quaternary ammonium compound efflux SMR transporter [Desulfovibrionaceae bacterium]
MTPLQATYAALGAAITSEVTATSLLPLTKEFSRPVPTIAMLLLYALSFYLMTIVVRTIPVGVVYAIWSGAGIVLVALVNHFVLRQALDLPAVLGMALIVAGVVVINLFSKTVPH